MQIEEMNREKITFRMYIWKLFQPNAIVEESNYWSFFLLALVMSKHGLRTPREEIAFTARPKIHSQSQILGTAKAYFVCHISPIWFDLIYAFIGCP